MLRSKFRQLDFSVGNIAALVIPALETLNSRGQHAEESATCCDRIAMGQALCARTMQRISPGQCFANGSTARSAAHAGAGRPNQVPLQITS